MSFSMEISHLGIFHQGLGLRALQRPLAAPGPGPRCLSFAAKDGESKPGSWAMENPWIFFWKISIGLENPGDQGSHPFFFHLILQWKPCWNFEPWKTHGNGVVLKRNCGRLVILPSNMWTNACHQLGAPKKVVSHQRRDGDHQMWLVVAQQCPHNSCFPSGWLTFLRDRQQPRGQEVNCGNEIQSGPSNVSKMVRYVPRI